MMRSGAGLSAVAALVVLDQWSKGWVRASVPLGSLRVLVPGAFDLTHMANRGVAFSALSSLPDFVRVPLLLFVPAVGTLAIAAFAIRGWRRHRPSLQTALVLILAGAIGNLVDRVRFGAVTDFVRFRVGERTLFVNNLADDFISVGVALAAVWMLRGGLALATLDDRS